MPRSLTMASSLIPNLPRIMPTAWMNADGSALFPCEEPDRDGAAGAQNRVQGAGHRWR
jgi:hypothetical protein